MNTNAVKICGLTKKYNGFLLDNISFEVPKGCIVGLIGENGAGKTTTLKAILNLIDIDDGEISILGESIPVSSELKEDMGIVFDDNCFHENITVNQLGNIMKNMYRKWDMVVFQKSCDRFSIPMDKKISKFSKGMKMKLSITVALSHYPRLLILDEATSGLDPIMRDEILDIFLEFIQDEEHSILVSSHITSDLEKVADYIVFLHKGKLIFFKPKDELLERYGIIKCGAAQFDKIDKSDIISYRKQDYEWQILVSERTSAEKKYPKAMILPATLDEIMLMYIKGEK